MNSSDEQRGELFIGDRGTLPLDARRAVVQLLSGPSIDGERNGILWLALLKDEATIRALLAEFFLELVIDIDLRVAFTRQVKDDGVDFPKLLRRVPLTFMDSIILLFLRQRLADYLGKGERAAVSKEEIDEHVAMYERVGNTDHAGFERRSSSSIVKLRESGILSRIRGSDSRYEISPILGILFSADHIAALSKAYAALASGEAVMPEDDKEYEESWSPGSQSEEDDE
jgi:hypothetical protein